MSEARYFNSAQKRIYRLGQNVGFALAFLIFSSVLYFILKSLNKLPDYIQFGHFIVAAMLLSLLILSAKGLKNG